MHEKVESQDAVIARAKAMLRTEEALSDEMCFVWMYAEQIAEMISNGRVIPEHLLLGLLKLSETPPEDFLLGEITPDKAEASRREIESVRQMLRENKINDATLARRKLRDNIQDICLTGSEAGYLLMELGAAASTAASGEGGDRITARVFLKLLTEEIFFIQLRQ
jgi:hypothetical protein